MNKIWKIIGGVIAALISILTLINLSFNILGIDNLKEWTFWNSSQDPIPTEPFNFKMEPEYIAEGQYSTGIPITIRITNLTKK